ncbi:hypothetical protein BH11BAC7_BH11BAC7_12310 [soil metagenome]
MGKFSGYFLIKRHPSASKDQQLKLIFLIFIGVLGLMVTVLSCRSSPTAYSIKE